MLRMPGTPSVRHREFSHFPAGSVCVLVGIADVVKHVFALQKNQKEKNYMDDVSYSANLIHIDRSIRSTINIVSFKAISHRHTILGYDAMPSIGQRVFVSSPQQLNLMIARD